MNETHALLRKRIVPTVPESRPLQGDQWLDLPAIAEIEISSEDAERAIDFALQPGRDGGWRATQSGEQVLRVIFDRPQTLRRIRLVFIENHHPRTQEFHLRSSADGKNFREVVRQQYNFNPPATETEDYSVELNEVKILELRIIPDISGGASTASLSELRLA